MRLAPIRLSPLVAAIILASAPLSFAVAAGSAVVESKPGSVAVGQSTAVTGTISAINAATREVTLTLPDASETVIACGPEVKNFAELRVGDAVEMEFSQALALELKKDSTAEVSGTIEGAVASAQPGSTPGAVGGIRARIVAEVMAVDPTTQTVTLRGPERTVDLKVNDPKQFENIAVGDRIEATYVEAMAVLVTHADAAD